MQEIYRFLQEGDEGQARERLEAFVERQFGLVASALNFEQSAVSLNSFKGTFEASGTRYFFKTHIEEGGETREYVGAELLERAGYPIILPAFSCVDKGRELLVYPYIQDPSVFDLVNEGAPDFEALQSAQESYDKRLFEIYKETFKEGEVEFPSVQQLFYGRLNGPRFEQFYGESREFLRPLEQVIKCARAQLCPENQPQFTVIGHGDAHNGNLFFTDEGLKLFDPAYAGRMDPFLDLAKPIFHNTFARWMYFPDRGTDLNDFERMFLDSKMQNVLRPLIAFLDERGVLPQDWEDRLRAALFCCCFLTVNLLDTSKYSPELAGFVRDRALEMATFNFKPYLS